ncbi:MAG TPA: LamG domain-containing protein [Solirubrobacterales bacterium]|jgi:hypothetical protein
MSAWSEALAALSPLSWLRLNDASGSTAVAVAGSNGTYVNGPTLGVKGLLSADSDKAVTLLRASSQRITVPDGASTDISDASFTLGCWVKLTSQPSSGQFFTIAAKTNAAGSNESYSIDYRNESGTTRLACGVRTSGGFTSTKVAKTLTTGTTYFIAFVYDGTNVFLYVDGVELTKAAKTGNVTANNELLYWGAYNNVDHLDGTIDEAFLLPGALSGAQVKALFEAAAKEESGPVDMEASLAGIGSAAGALISAGSMGASLSGTGILTGELRGIASMAAALSGQGGLSGDLRALASMAAALTGGGVLGGELMALASMAASLEARGELNGEIAQILALAASLAGSGVLSASLEAIVAVLPFVDLPTELKLEGRETSMTIAGRAVELGIASLDTALAIAGRQTTLTIASRSARLSLAAPDSRLTIAAHKTELDLDG